MEEKLEGKKEWITPEIIDLDVEKTGKGVKDTNEGDPVYSPTYGPS